LVVSSTDIYVKIELEILAGSSSRPKLSLRNQLQRIARIMNFEPWLTSIGKSPKTAKNYSNAVSGAMSKWAVDEGLVQNSLYEVINADDFQPIVARLRELPIYEARNTAGNGMYSAALNCFADYLANANGEVSQIADSDRLFPEGLQKWAGHRDGGVRRPFNDDSGRPTGQQIETPLISRLREWSADLVAGKKVPRALLLVGGPGNGKTDAVEGCIDFFDEDMGAGGKLKAAFASKYNVSGGELPPRKVIVELSSIIGNLPAHLQSSISLVQDATEADSSQDGSPEELLLTELEGLLSDEQPGIYLCCVNRGILARTAEIANQSNDQPDVTAFLNTITQCVTSSPNSPSCWPLQGYAEVALWPMDVESLVDKELVEDGKSVAHQIFEVALQESRWESPCQLNTRCPFCRNRKILSAGSALDSLVDLLHYYELSSGKRWTFRDLFSLVPYLLVGEPSELEIGGKPMSPCEWSAAQHKFATSGRLNSPERDRAPYLLMSHLYHHRLFPRWPSFDSGEHRLAKRALLKVKNDDEGLGLAASFFRFTARSKHLSTLVRGDVPVRVRSFMGPQLDPAIASGDGVLFMRNGEETTVTDLEERFSLSIGEGLNLAGSQLETLERDVLERLSLADESLMEDKFPRNRTRQARLLQSTIRQFSARVAKRSLGSRRAVCLDSDMYSYYLSATKKPSVLNGVRKGLKSLLNDSNNQFRAGLATTFGQPVAHRSRDVSLSIDSPINVAVAEKLNMEGRPIDYLPYLLVDKHYIPLTFELFKALNEVNDGLHDASLPGEIYSLLDRVKSLVSGRIVRDQKILSEDPRIILGSSNDAIEYVSGEFVYSNEVQ
jgi:hypothetical protein